MFLVEHQICWSASDLTAASACEYGVLRRLDVLLDRASAAAHQEDPLLERIARLGDRHEADVLEQIKLSTAERQPRAVAELDRVRAPLTGETLLSLHQATLAAFASDADVVFQAGFYDGEFHGYADFVERTENGWLVSDAKLARHARPSALLQLAAYADQLQRAGIDVAPRAALLLGSGVAEEFPLSDILPVFRERRRRLRQILAEHRGADAPVGWGDERYVACGRCAECQAAVIGHDDVIQVAGLRMDQRKKLRGEGVRTVADLASRSARPEDMRQDIFVRLRAQARLQLAQHEAGPDEHGLEQVSYELTDRAQQTLALLPAASPGDLFFDFEGDPLHNEGDLSRWGLEYLWGVMEAPQGGRSSGTFTPLWAHDSTEEKTAFKQFMDMVAERRKAHPDMHIYHYAPYETTALKRLAAQHQTHESELDDLLRSAVFVDLYGTVRGAVRVSQPSYSIKKLEPLYMGKDELRKGDVQAGDVSIVEYHDYRMLAAAGDVAAAAEKLAALADYNEYDCLSTLRLRDWLLGRAAECGADRLIEPVDVDRGAEQDEEHDATRLALMALAGSENRAERTPEQQAYAMLASSLGYYRRESLPFWWSHFDRLCRVVDDWDEERDVFRVDSVEVEQDWHLSSARATNPRRKLRLTGQWGAGSTPGSRAKAIYSSPLPPGVALPEKCLVAAGENASIDIPEEDETSVVLEETAKPGETHGRYPLALVPASPPPSGVIAEAIREVADAAATWRNLPERACLDLLLRRPPRQLGGGPLPSAGDTRDDVVAALLASDSSYVAVQGPPGTGKSYTGARVIKRLVEEHHWRVGVVAQSHAVVETLLEKIVEAGVDPALVGKSDNRSSQVAWTEIKKAKGAQFLEEGTATGCVIGGTAWTFTAKSLVERGGLDLLVIDEAGQFALAPTLGASVVAQRLLLLGDPQQLPQVSQGTHPEPVDQSALGWLLDGHDTIPPELGYFLGTSYRMHPTLCESVSALSYDRRLTSEDCTAERSMECVAPGLRVVRLVHEQNRTESVEEAAEVVRQVSELLGTSWLEPETSQSPRPLDERDFLVVAPYNAQVNLIRRELGKAGYTNVRVGTVDKFQGKQAPVVIVSMTASSHGDVPRGMGFLLNRNRVNVAVSRAQWLAVLIRSEALTAYMPTSTHGLLELGAFIGLCDSA